MRKLLLALALTMAAAGAQAVPLSTLLSGGSITAGDKLFDNWLVGRYDTSIAGKTFDAGNIDVTALTDGGMDPGPGLSFTVSQGELSISGDDLSAYIDLQFGFRASVLTPGLKIKDNSLRLTGSSLVYTADGENDLGVDIKETIGTAVGAADLGDKEVVSRVLDELVTQTLLDSAAFAPQSEIWVTKYIRVWALDALDTATLISFDQRFSQISVPEPATLALLALGFAGLAATRRRKQ
jgi:hypothetical protein